MEDLTVVINRKVPEEITIEFVQAIEKAIDKTLTPLGFSRTTTEKGDRVVLNYRQFATFKDGKAN